MRTVRFVLADFLTFPRGGLGNNDFPGMLTLVRSI
jgi:hypothetical protein